MQKLTTVVTATELKLDEVQYNEKVFFCVVVIVKKKGKVHYSVDRFQRNFLKMTLVRQVETFEFKKKKFSPAHIVTRSSLNLNILQLVDERIFSFNLVNFHFQCSKK